MAKIALASANALSHINATLKIANWFSDRGHEVVYVLQDGLYRHVIEANGFEFVLANRYGNPPPVAGPDVSSEARRDQRGESGRSEHLLDDVPVANALKMLAPDLIILDTFLSVCAVRLCEEDSAIVVFQTKVSSNPGWNVPPPSSWFVPRTSLFSAACVKLLWTAYGLSRFLESLQQRIRSRGRDFSSPIRELATSVKYPSGTIDFYRPFSVGIRNRPELVLSPRCFDFPWRERSRNQIYVGPAAFLDRHEQRAPRDQALIDLLSHRKNEEGRRIIFCSLGTVGVSDAGRRRRFIEKVISAFGGDPDCCLVVAVGDDLAPRQFQCACENVYLVNRVPQIMILEIANVMITHGGMQSVSECILSEVPMVVYPLGLDQPGNSSRVVYHGIGVRGRLRFADADSIRELVEEVLQNRRYVHAIGELRQEMMSSGDFNAGMEQLVGMINS